MRATGRVITAQAMRVAWESEKNIYLQCVSYLTSPKIEIVKKIWIPRGSDSPHGTKPVEALIVFNGTKEELSKAKGLIFHIPGGGFVCMPPERHLAYLKKWAKDTGYPVVSFNYHKAPEHPYPYALNELFDAYRTICSTHGRCLGIDSLPIKPLIKNGIKFNEIAVSFAGDSAGGNLCASLMLLIIEAAQNLGDNFVVPRPRGIVFIYPALEFNMGVWMNNDELKLFRQQSVKSLASLWETKSHCNHESPLATYDDTKSWGGVFSKASIKDQVQAHLPKKPDLVKVPSERGLHKIDTTKYPWVRNKANPLAMSSKITYFDDRVLSAEVFRAVAIWYVGPNNTGNFQSDYYVSPLLAPDHLLAQFPKTYFICGERDPLVDDTIIMSGKIRNAKRKLSRSNSRRKAASFDPDLGKLTPLSNSVALDTSIDGFIIGNDNSNANSNVNSDHDDDSEYDSDLSDNASIMSTSTVIQKPKMSFASRFAHRVKSYVSLFQQPPAVPTESFDYTTTVSVEDVHVKLITGISHGFMNFEAFLPEAKAAIKLTGTWLQDILHDNNEEED
jgi:acetyl esterase/lipase